jgi:flagellin-like hook-associated protein FlgL
MLGAGIATVTTQLNIVRFYRKNDVSLADSMVHLSSGKRVLKPEDNTGDFFRSRRIDGENRSYHYIRRDIGAAIGMTEAGEEVGRQVFEQVSHLRRLVKDYYDPATSDEGKQAIESEFYALSQSVSDTIGQAEYDDRQLVSAGTLRSFTLDPHNRTTTFDIVIEADEVVDGAALTSIDISGGRLPLSPLSMPNLKRREATWPA